MAKGKKAKNKSDGGFPSKVAGFRVPKKVRKIAGGAVSFLDHPVVADIIAAALFTAANTLREKPEARKAARKAKSKTVRATRGAKAAVAVKPKRKKAAKKS